MEGFEETMAEDAHQKKQFRHRDSFKKRMQNGISFKHT